MYDNLVGAGRLDVAGLLALVADALAVGFGCAVTGDVADLATWINQYQASCNERIQ